MQRPRPRAANTLGRGCLIYSERVVISLPVFISTLLSDRFLMRRPTYALLAGTPKRDEPRLSPGCAPGGCARAVMAAVLIASSPAARHASSAPRKTTFPMIRKVLGASAAVPTAGSAVAAARAAVRAGTGHRSGYEPVLNRADFVTKITHLWFAPPAARR